MIHEWSLMIFMYFMSVAVQPQMVPNYSNISNPTSTLSMAIRRLLRVSDSHGRYAPSCSEWYIISGRVLRSKAGWVVQTSTQVISRSKLFGSLGKKVAWSRSQRLEAKLSYHVLRVPVHSNENTWSHHHSGSSVGTHSAGTAKFRTHSPANPTLAAAHSFSERVNLGAAITSFPRSDWAFQKARNWLKTTKLMRLNALTV